MGVLIFDIIHCMVVHLNVITAVVFFQSQRLTMMTTMTAVQHVVHQTRYTIGILVNIIIAMIVERGGN